MNKRILSILAITFCASCGLFAEDTIEAPAVEVVAPEETTACCGTCDEEVQVDETVAGCGCSQPRRRKDDNEGETLARCGKRPPRPQVIACGCGCGACAEAVEVSADEPVLCCGTCQEEVQPEETLAGCSCGKDKLVA